MSWELGSFWTQNGTTEIWEAASGAAFNTATLIWQGRGTSVTISKQDTLKRAYWARLATVGGQTSDTEPSGAGLEAGALSSGELVTDPEFVGSTSDEYYWRYNPSGGSAATITLTGGALGGYASIPGAGTTTPVYIVSRRHMPYQCARGEIYTVTLRARIPSSFSGILRANVIRHARAATNSTFDPTPASGLAGAALGGLLIDASEIGSDFTEFVGLCFVRDVSGIAGNDLPRISAIIGTIVATSGSVDVDYVSVMPGANCPPRNKEYTSTTDLASSTSEYFHNLQYNSASGGTITLPYAETEHIGARIYFEQVNTGLLTIAAQAGETLQASPNLTGNRALAGRYARAYAEVIDASTWRLVGNI